MKNKKEQKKNTTKFDRFKSLTNYLKYLTHEVYQNIIYGNHLKKKTKKLYAWKIFTGVQQGMALWL